MSVYVEPQYLPCMAWLHGAAAAGEVYLPLLAPFEKQSYRNRCYLAGPQGRVLLVIPVMESRRRLPLQQIQIDRREDWSRRHLQAIRSAYGRAPYWEHYEESLAEAMRAAGRETELLPALIRMMEWLIGALGANIRLHTVENVPAGMPDYTDTIHPKKPLPAAPLGSAYAPVPYIQCFSEKTGYQWPVSAIDALFCVGPHAMQQTR